MIMDDVLIGLIVCGLVLAIGYLRAVLQQPGIKRHWRRENARHGADNPSTHQI